MNKEQIKATIKYYQSNEAKNMNKEQIKATIKYYQSNEAKNMNKEQIKATIEYYQSNEQGIISSRDLEIVLSSLSQEKCTEIANYVREQTEEDEVYQFFYEEDNTSELLLYISKNNLKNVRKQIADKYNRIRFILAVFVVRDKIGEK